MTDVNWKSYQLIQNKTTLRLPDSSEGIQQVSSRVSSVIQHFVKGEDVVIQPVMRKISIFDAAISNRCLSSL